MLQITKFENVTPLHVAVRGNGLGRPSLNRIGTRGGFFLFFYQPRLILPSPFSLLWSYLLFFWNTCVPQPRSLHAPSPCLLSTLHFTYPVRFASPRYNLPAPTPLLRMSLRTKLSPALPFQAIIIRFSGENSGSGHINGIDGYPARGLRFCFY